MGFTLSSTAFDAGQTIPLEFTCQGKDNTPSLSWSDPPQGTKSFVMIMDDPDASAGTWVHWVVFNIPGNLRTWHFDNFNVPQGVINGNNSWGTIGYRGPCPPPGKAHHYIFSLYALDQALNLPRGSTAAEVKEMIKNHLLGQATLVGIYRKN